MPRMIILQFAFLSKIIFYTGLMGGQTLEATIKKDIIFFYIFSLWMGVTSLCNILHDTITYQLHATITYQKRK